MGWKVAVDFKPSKLHGMGVFAAERIPAGTEVWTLDENTRLSSMMDLVRLPKPRLWFALHGGYYHPPSGKFVWYDDGMHLVNHADGDLANIGTMEWVPLDQDNCVALRDIEAGEEILEDYTFWSIFELEPNHWVRRLYRDHCPDHYEFQRALFDRKIAA